MRICHMSVSMKQFKLRFTNRQLERISDIIADIGQVFFGATFIPFIFGLDSINILSVVLGLTSSLACWILSIKILEGKQV